MKKNIVQGVKSVIQTDSKKLDGINDSLKDALNITDDEQLLSIQVFEDGVVIEPGELILDID